MHAPLQALTATTDGDVVVWDEQGITAQMGTRATDRRASKLMRLHQQVRVCVCVWVYVTYCMCVCIRVRAHARVCAYMCVCNLVILRCYHTC